MIKRFKEYVPFIIIAILLIIIVFKSCNSKPVEVHNNEPLKIKVKELTVKKDSSMVAANKSDTVRLKGIDRWHKAKHDTLYLPCKELIVICDSIILIDSTEISQLKNVINYSDSIIVNQKVMLYNDSLDLLAAKKYGNKQRRQKNLALIGLGVITALSVVK